MCHILIPAGIALTRFLKKSFVLVETFPCGCIFWNPDVLPWTNNTITYFKLLDIHLYTLLTLNEFQQYSFVQELKLVMS